MGAGEVFNTEEMSIPLNSNTFKKNKLENSYEPPVEGKIQFELLNWDAQSHECDETPGIKRIQLEMTKLEIPELIDSEYMPQLSKSSQRL